MSVGPFTTLGQVSTTVRNGLFAKRPTNDPSGTPILRISAVRDGRVSLSDLRYVVSLAAKDLERFALRENDLLLTRYNGSRHLVGISGLVPAHGGPLIHPDKLIRVQLDTAVAGSRFVNLQLASQQVRDFLEPRIRTTAGQSGIAGGDVRAIPLWLPPLPEQRRIVEILEDHLSRLDAASRSLDTVAYRSRSLLLSQLAREFRPSSGAESTLGAVADWGSGGTPKARTPTFYEGGEIPWVVSGELKDDVLTEVAGRITQEGLKESSAKWVPAGALLVAMYGATIGRLALTTEPVTTNQAVAHALPHHDVVTAEYMFWFLMSQRRLLVAAGQGGAQPNISQTVLKAWPIRIPALRVQAEAVLAAHSLRDSTRRLQSSAQALHARQGLLRGALLSAAFTGRLTGRAADDEVVEELANV